jgi:putative flippase GtrA
MTGGLDQPRRATGWNGTGRRAAVFGGVGALGFVLQVSLLWFLTAGLRIPVLPATCVAVAVTVVHNFVWHLRVTWRDRSDNTPVAARFLRFVGANGLVSMIGTTTVTALLAAAGLPVLAANAVAVALSSLLNFVLADRAVFAVLVVAALHGGTTTARAAALRPETLAAWSDYVRHTEARIARELATPGRQSPLGDPAGQWRRRAMAGELVLFEGDTRGPDGDPIAIPGGLVHHWAGAVFVRRVTLDALLAELQHPTHRGWLPDDVLAMRVRGQSPDQLRVSMLIERKSVIDVTYDTEHLVSYVRHDATHASSRSVSTRISEVEHAGTTAERRLSAEEDHGFLWRLNAYWRYEQVDGGVLVTCESLSLSRHVPYVIRLVAAPLIDRVARESLSRTLGALRTGLTGAAAIR